MARLARGTGARNVPTTKAEILQVKTLLDTFVNGNIFSATDVVGVFSNRNNSGWHLID